MTRRRRVVIAGVGIAAASAGIAAIRAVRRAASTWLVPPEDPVAFGASRRPPGTTTVVACLGDSITHGVMSGDYVHSLRTRLGGDGYAFINGGKNGDLAWNVLQRLDAIIACRPDAVTLLIGTNDVLATLGPDWEAGYRSQQHIPRTPSLEWYGENVRRILGRLRAETDARIAILDLPPIGQDPDSDVNARVRTYNAALRAIAAEAEVPVLPLNECLLAAVPAGGTAPAFDGSKRLMGVALFRRVVLRRAWNRVSADHGLALHTDHVHLNDRAAGIIAGLIEAWLTSAP